MYFWKINELVEQIRNKALTEKNKFFYLMVFVLLNVLIFELLNYFPLEDFNNFDIAWSCLYFLITITGSYLCFTANGGEAGSGFLEKYFSIGFVVSIRTIVFFLPVIIALGLYWTLWEHEVVGTSLIDIIVGLVIELSVYYKMYVYIKKTNS